MLFGSKGDGDIGDDGGSEGGGEYGNHNVITDCLESLPTAEYLVSLSDGDGGCGNDGGGDGSNVYVTEYYKLPAEGELASL